MYFLLTLVQNYSRRRPKAETQPQRPIPSHSVTGVSQSLGYGLDPKLWFVTIKVMHVSSRSQVFSQVY